MSDIFLCYSKQDIDTALRLVQLFETEGWRVFIDKKTQVGHRWHKVIENELHAARAVVVLWSATSRDSDFVLEEAEYGKRKNILFPAFIEAVEYPYGFGRIQTADLTGWTHPQEHDGLTQLLDSLRTHLNGDAPQSPSKPPPVIAKPLPAPGPTFRDTLRSGGEGPLMTVIPAGCFLMGSPENELGRLDTEGQQHEVIIAQPFALGVYAVTFAEYDRFCQETGRKESGDVDWGRENRPVINVSWHDAQVYCAWLCAQTGQSYRLPSEAEWEYVCRAGTTTPFYTGETIHSGQANFGKTHKKTLPVGSFSPNKFGLYDMHGNVWEWTQDCWHQNYQNAPGDGSAWLEANGGDCDRRVVRGGSWNDDPQFLRSAFRDGPLRPCELPHRLSYRQGFVTLIFALLPFAGCRGCAPAGLISGFCGFCRVDQRSVIHHDAVSRAVARRIALRLMAPYKSTDLQIFRFDHRQVLNVGEFRQ